MLTLFLVVVLSACDAQADLVAYFGSPSPDDSPTATTPPTATPPTNGQPTATSSATLPAPTDTPASTPAWSPLPTRPAGLAPFDDLRANADVTDISRLLANFDGLVGSTVYFEGRVNEIRHESEGRVRARIKIGDLFVHLVYRTDRYWGDHPLVQGDRIRVVGEFLGLSDASTGERVPEIEPIDMVHRFA